MPSSSNSKQWEAELFRLLVENSSDYAVFVIDLTGRVLTWNPAAERVLGYRESEILGESSFRVFTPEDRAAGVPEKELKTTIETGRATDDRWHLRKDGSRLWVTGVMTALKDGSGEILACAKIMRDFTEAKLAADALRESEERLRIALEAAEMGTWLWRSSSDELILDESLRGLLGLTSEKAVMSLDTFLRAVHEDDRSQVRAEFDRCLKAGGDFCVEFRITWDDGTVHWFRDQGRSFDHEGGSRQFIAGACLDISARRQFEEEMRQADRKKDEFLALLSHELRNPLAPLRNGLQVMRLSTDSTTLTEIRSMMERQLGHMVRLIDDLLDISRLSQNKLHLRRSRILLAEVIGSSVESVRPLIETAGIKLSVSLPAEPVFLDADLTRLAQVFSNLLTNSAKFTSREGNIWLDVSVHQELVEVRLRDDGIGIPPESIDHIFDMFAQLDRSTERATGGLGIGLALVKGLVEMHGGTVTAYSGGLGQGATFTVILPINYQTSESTTVDLGDTEYQGLTRNRRILVVDDNRDSANSMAMVLRQLGNEVSLAYDGIEAVAAAEDFRPDIVLMDIGMPKLNGYGATEQIRNRPWGRDVRIVAVTGWGQEGDREQSKKAGCDGHLVKPVKLSELFQVLNELSAENPR